MKLIESIKKGWRDYIAIIILSSFGISVTMGWEFINTMYEMVQDHKEKKIDFAVTLRVVKYQDNNGVWHEDIKYKAVDGRRYDAFEKVGVFYYSDKKGIIRECH